MSDRREQQFEDFYGPEFVGRERELALLIYSWRQAAQGNGALVLVSGDVGIGKTTLVQNLVRHARRDDSLILTGAAYDLSATPPYGPWLDMSENLPEVTDPPEFPEILRRGVDSVGHQSQQELFEVFRSYFFSLAEKQPVILVLEDLHWADHATLELVRFLGRSVGEHRVLIVATYRDDEISKDNALLKLLPALVRESGAQRMRLHPLDREEVNTLVTSVYQLGERESDILAGYLVKRAHGNPLFVNELLRALRDEGRLILNGDCWTVGDLGNVPVPPLLRQVIERRLERLDSSQRMHLEAAAVIGHGVPLELWRNLSDLTVQQQISIVEHAIAANLMSASEDPRMVFFSHALIREVLYQDTLPLRRQFAHLRIAELMMDSDDNDPDSVAHHLIQASDVRAVEWLMIAGERAHRSYAWKTAAERFAAAGELLNGQPARLQERGWLLYRTARLLRYSELPRAISLLSEAERIGREVNDAVLIAFSCTDRGATRMDFGEEKLGFEEMTTGIHALDALSGEDSFSPEIRRWIADVGQGATTDPLPMLNVRRGTFALWNAVNGHFTDAIAMAHQFIAEYEAVSVADSSMLSGYADALRARAIAHAATSRPDHAKAAFFKAHDILNRIGHYNQAAMTVMRYLSNVHLPFNTTDLDERRTLLQLMAESAYRAEHAVTSMASDAFVNFDLYWLEAKWDRIRSHGETALEFPASFFRQSASLALARLDREAGYGERAWGHIERLLPHGPESNPGESKFPFSIEVQPLAANLAMDDAELKLARRWIESHDRWLSWSGADVWAPMASLLWARYHHLAGARTLAIQHAERSCKLADEPEQPLSRLQAKRFLGDLHMEEGNYGDAECQLDSSLQLAESCVAPFERMLSLLALGRLRATEGRMAEARTLIDEVRTGCAALGARRILREADSIANRISSRGSNPAGLTPRELEVLRCIAEGLSDNRIAEELFVSRRTVTTHVSNIFNKLTVNSRAAAVAAASRLGLLQ